MTAGVGAESPSRGQHLHWRYPAETGAGVGQIGPEIATGDIRRKPGPSGPGNRDGRYPAETVAAAGAGPWPRPGPGRGRGRGRAGRTREEEHPRPGRSRACIVGAMLPRTTREPRASRPGILLYGMYDMSALDRAPTVRIAMMTAALSGRTHTERITGGRFGRFAASVRWLASGGPRRVGAVYVESPTSSAMPTDLAFLALMRLLGKPVGVYFRDAYQLFRDTYPRRARRQILSDVLWRVTTPMLRGIASRCFAPSRRLAEALRLHDPTLLPPGTDPSQPNLGSGAGQVVAYVGSTNTADGFDLLLAAMASVHERCPDATLNLIGSPPADALPGYVQTQRSSREGLPEVLRSARLCVIPRPINAYSNLAVPIKLWDYLSLGKPVVATAATETASILAASGAGIATPDTAEGLAEGLLQLLTDPHEASRLAANARTFACAPGATWDDRARVAIESLGLAEPARSAREPAANG